ncbi:MAG: MBL fold metallo-hydrolase [Treponema sp.]|nr:MBL fold metallo-hydrolase [Treponema sp.]
MSLVKLNENISYLPASKEPFSADVVFIKTNKSTWIFDVGMGSPSYEEIKKIQGPKNVVISHFHPDHLMNLPRITYDNLYLSKYTKRYTFKGRVITEISSFDEDPQISLVPIPSSHAKGCIALICGDYAFMGDSTYAKEKIGNHTYNSQLLNDMIKVMEELPVKYFCLSHDKNFVQSKESVITLYKDIYSRRKPDDPIISVEDFFNPDGSVKEC